MFTVTLKFLNGRQPEVHRHVTLEDAANRYLSYCWLIGQENVYEVAIEKGNVLLGRLSKTTGRTYFFNSQEAQHYA